MLQQFLAALAGAILLTGHSASAEESLAKCQQDYVECVARITSVNDVEIKDANEACKQEQWECRNKVYAAQEKEQERAEEKTAEPDEH